MQAYPCLCAYYAIYKLGRFSFYLLVPRHTSPYSLLANAMLMCRFAPPLAFNFMAGIALPPGKSYSPGRDVTETVRPLCLCSNGRMQSVLMMLCCDAPRRPCKMDGPGVLHHYSHHVPVYCIALAGREFSALCAALSACLLGRVAWNAHHLEALMSAASLSWAAGNG